MHELVLMRTKQKKNHRNVVALFSIQWEQNSPSMVISMMKKYGQGFTVWCNLCFYRPKVNVDYSIVALMVAMWFFARR